MDVSAFYQHVFDAIAPAYDRLRIYPDAGRRLASIADLRPGERICDVAAGTGDVLQPALRMLGPSGQAAAVDLSPGMLAQAQEAVGEQPGVAYHLAEADALPFPDAAFDCVTCGLGLSFFPDVHAAAREAGRVLRPGGRYAVSVFAGEPLAPALPLFVALLRRLLPPAAVAPPENASLGEPERLSALLRASGFDPLRDEVEEYSVVFPTLEEWWETAIASVPGAELARLSPAGRRAFETEHRADLAPLLTAEGLRCTVGVRFVLATRVAAGGQAGPAVTGLSGPRVP